MPTYVCKKKIENIVLYFDLSNIDLRKLLLQGKSDRLLRYVDKAIEDACTLVRELGEQHGNITRGHLLMNLKNYNPIQHGCLNCNFICDKSWPVIEWSISCNFSGIPFLLRILFDYLNHWPECVDKVIAVNGSVI